MPRVRSKPVHITTDAKLLIVASLTTGIMKSIRKEKPRLFAMLVKAACKRKVRSDGRPRPAPGPRLDFDNLPEDSFSLFRFDIDDVALIAERLGLPELVVTPNRDVAPRREALAIVLRRLAYPCALRHLRGLFGRSVGAISGIFTTTVELIQARWSDFLGGLDTDRILPQVPRFAAAIRRRGSPIRHIFAFIDGTLRPVCRCSPFLRSPSS